jgi:hypothetical protein
VTPRKESRKAEKQPSTFNVAQRWFAEHRKNTLLLAIAILSPLASLYMLQNGVAAAKQGFWVWNTDANGVMIFAPVEMADPTSSIFKEITIQAAESFLKRNPAGISNPELLKRYFVNTAAAGVDREMKAEKAERERRNLFDQCEFTKEPEFLSGSGGVWRFRVTGYIKRSGNLGGVLEADVGDFTVLFELRRNPDMKRKGMFPYQVTQYRKTVKWRGAGRTEVWSSVSGEGQK